MYSFPLLGRRTWTQKDLRRVCLCGVLVVLSVAATLGFPCSAFAQDTPPIEEFHSRGIADGEPLRQLEEEFRALPPNVQASHGYCQGLIDQGLKLWAERGDILLQYERTKDPLEARQLHAEADKEFKQATALGQEAARCVSAASRASP